MDKLNKKNIIIIILFFINIALVILFFTKGEKTNDMRETQAKLDDILTMQKNNAINKYLETDNNGSERSSENNKNIADNNLVILKQEVRKILKEELKEVLEEVKDSQESGFIDNNKKSKIPLAELKEAFTESNAIVDNAITMGKWTDEDAGKMRNFFYKLDRKHQEKILKKLIPAINRGEVTTDLKQLGLF